MATLALALEGGTLTVSRFETLAAYKFVRRPKRK
jgi:hypothetical protein